MLARSSFVIAACATLLLVGSGSVSAQNRFTVRSQDVIVDVSGLRVLTLYDNQSSQCYTLFIIDAPDAEPMPAAAGEPPPAEDTVNPAITDAAVEQSLQRIREAAVRRDRLLAELKARAPMFWLSPPTRNGPDIPVPSYADELERREIEEEYKRAVEAEIPTYAWPSRTPGSRTGGWDDTTANTQRRAILDPEPSATMKGVMDKLTRLEGLLQQMMHGPRFAVSGPVACRDDARVKEMR